MANKTSPGTADPHIPGADLFAYFNEIAIIASLTVGMFERRLPNGLTYAQFGVLNSFHRVDEVATPTRLAIAFQVTGGAMTHTLKKLEAQKLVKIEPDPDSGRQKRVTVTAKGRRMRERSIAAASPLLEDFAAALDLESIRKQTRVLAEVRQFLDTYRYQKPG